MTQEDWTTRKWRPYMAWMYMLICVLDFAIFPILWSMLQAHYNGQVVNQWDPLTLKGAGLFHMAMGAVLGVTAWSRGQEKIAGANNATFISDTSSFGSSSSSFQSQPTTFGVPPTTAVPKPTAFPSDPVERNTRND